MSGVGEALAIVSCVAGLIQAYDAGSRIVKQIKARRQAHDALPPSDLMEESIEKGKRQIEQIVADGKQRFGPSFEEGDTTAQLALFKITIATQSALLAGLTQARDDDGIIDFDTCIDTSDKGRTGALVALNELFQRKLDEEMERKRNMQSKPEPPQQINLIPPPPAGSPEKEQLVAPPMSVPRTEPTPPSSPPIPKMKRSRTFTDVVFRRKESHPQASQPTQLNVILPSVKRESLSKSPQEDYIVPNPRRNTAASTSSSATWSSAESRGSIVGDPSTLRPLGAIERSNTGTSLVGAMSRQSTSASTFSAVSNLSTASTLSPITRFGGCCKNAHEVREGHIKSGLSLAPIGLYGQAMVYKCASTKCQFAGQAGQDKKGYCINDKVMGSLAGLELRWLFLAKSHMQQKDARFPSYRCLVCTMLGDESAIFEGSKALLFHVASHQGGSLGETPLEGPLVFSNRGARQAFDNEFDIKFPEIGQPGPVPSPPTSHEGAAVVVAAMVPTESRKVENRMPPKSMNSYAYEADDNPWALA